jgi:hypothetical protein
MKWLRKIIKEYVEDSGEEQSDVEEGMYVVKKRKYIKWKDKFDAIQKAIQKMEEKDNPEPTTTLSAANENELTIQKQIEEVVTKRTFATTSSESEDDLEGDPTYVYEEEEEDFDEDELMNSKPNFKIEICWERYYRKLREDKKNTLVICKDRIEKIIKMALKRFEVEKWEYDNKEVFKAINFESRRMNLDGNDVFCGQYMKKKENYEEKLKEWEKLKFEKTRKKWVRKEIYSRKPRKTSPPKEIVQDNQYETNAQETIEHQKNKAEAQKKEERVDVQQAKHEEQKSKIAIQQIELKTEQVDVVKEEVNRNIVNKKNTNQYQAIEVKYFKSPQDSGKESDKTTIIDEGNNLSVDDIINLQKNNILWKNENEYEIYGDRKSVV